MPFNYSQSLNRIRDARNKRSKTSLTKRFFMTLKQENKDMPSFNVDMDIIQPYSVTQDDVYTNTVVMPHVPLEFRQGRVAKSSTALGNCLFNAASVALIGNESLATELRVRTVIELAAFFDFYMKEYENVDFEGMCGITFEEDIHNCAVDGGDASAWALCGLASVIERPILSLYPSTINSDNSTEADQLAALNRSHRPRKAFDVERYPPIAILWTRTTVVPHVHGMMWCPNHFVPLIEISTDASLMDIGCNFEDSVGCSETQDWCGEMSDIHNNASSSTTSSSAQPVPAPRRSPLTSSSSSAQPVPAPRMSRLTLSSSHPSQSPSQNVAMRTVEVFEARKGGTRLCVDGYMFVRDRHYKDKTYWRCYPHSESCKIRIQTSLHVDGGDTPNLTAPEILVAPQEHDHPPTTGQVVRCKLVSEMRQHVKQNSLQSLSSTYEHVIVHESNNCDKVLAPSYSSVKTMLKRQRSAKVPRLPASVSDIHLEGDWAKTLSNEVFVLPEVQGRTDVIFTCDSNLRCLTQCNTWYVDGTFATCPSPFVQVFSIHGLFNNTVVPLCYALLSDKLSTTYYSVFNRIRDAASAIGCILNPVTILSDFEAALIQCVALQFPNVTHSGCHFHFGQAIWRKVQDCNLTNHYKTDTVVTTFVESCVSLAFLPPAEVERHFESAATALTPQYGTLLSGFVSYFRSTWIQGNFSITMWNKYGQDHRHRTNNIVESWHSGLKRKLPIHPNIYTYITAIKQIQSCSEIRIAQSNNGDSPATRKPKYVRLDARLTKLHKQHVDGIIDTATLWRSVRHTVHKFKK